MNRKFFFFLILSFLINQFPSQAEPFVTARLWGRLGNQFFIIAAATSLALDNGAQVILSDFEFANEPECELKGNYVPSSLRSNYEHIFKKFNIAKIQDSVQFVYKEPSFSYSPIPYHENMIIEGWFQSEKYFKNNRKKIIKLFSPSKKIKKYLKSNYSNIIEHPNTVSIHLRCYNKENPFYDNVYYTYGKEYIEKAMSHFPQDSLYVVFSDDINWAKEQVKGLAKNVIFIEKEAYYYDFYLMSMCQHNIITNSTFSWWAAYLNKNPKKKVVAPDPWFTPQYKHCTKDLIPSDWIIVQVNDS